MWIEISLKTEDKKFKETFTKWEWMKERIKIENVKET